MSKYLQNLKNLINKYYSILIEYAKIKYWNNMIFN